MAACDGLRMYEKPLPIETHPPWKHVKSIKTVNHYSFVELFGELHLKENNYVLDSLESSASSSPSSSLTSVSAFTNDENVISSINSDNVSTCTEELAFESSDDVDQDSHSYDWQPLEDRVRTTYSRSGSMKHLRRSFPPPISCIGRNGKPWVCFESVREDGRFILTEIRVPTQECLHACRKNGRLKMQFVQSDDFDEDEEESSEEDDEGTSEIEDGDAESTWMEVENVKASS